MNFRRASFLISLSIHSALGLVMWIALRNSSVDVDTTSSVGAMNWDVEAAPQPKAMAHKRSSAVQATSSEQSPSQESSTSAAPSADSGKSAGGAGPDSSQVQSYLSMIRSHLAEAIHIHEPRGAAAATLILKIKIQRSGKLEAQEIEKTSGNASVDQGVLQALDSILPLPPFPPEWEKAGINPERMTVRVPVEIRQNP